MVNLVFLLIDVEAVYRCYDAKRRSTTMSGASGKESSKCGKQTRYVYMCIHVHTCSYVEGNGWCVCLSSSVVHSALYTKSKVLTGTLLTLLSCRSIRGRACDAQAYTSVPF